jgi:hypothetical protein
VNTVDCNRLESSDLSLETDRAMKTIVTAASSLVTSKPDDLISNSKPSSVSTAQETCLVNISDLIGKASSEITEKVYLRDNDSIVCSNRHVDQRCDHEFRLGEPSDAQLIPEAWRKK